MRHEWTQSPSYYKKYGQSFDYRIAEAEPYFQHSEELDVGGIGGTYYSHGMNIITAEGVTVVGLFITSETFKNESYTSIKQKVSNYIGKPLVEQEGNNLSAPRAVSTLNGFNIVLTPRPWISPDTWILEVKKYL